MNKKQISVILAVIMLCNTGAVIYAEKKDVPDPVLREIIAELTNKMPRFINKYGASVFVSDEQITRSSLLSALYEYDKNSSSPSGMVSKKDFDLLNTRLTSLEKNFSLAKMSGKSNASSGSVDIIRVMNDLEPNMPMLLDNSLAESKVFKALKQQVEAGSPSSSTQYASTDMSKTTALALASLQKNLDEVNKKVYNVEMSLTSAKETGTSTPDSSKKTALALADLQKNLDEVNKKIQNVEMSLTSAKEGSSKLTNAQVSASLVNMREELTDIKNKMNSFEAKLTVKEISGSQTAFDKEVNDLKRTMVQMQQSYVNMAKKVNNLENNKNYAGTGTGLNDSQYRNLNEKINSIMETVSEVPTSDYVVTQISKSNNETTSDIKRIEKRLNSLEKSGKVSAGGDSSKSSQTNTVAKISLGITMVAALFIAR